MFRHRWLSFSATQCGLTIAVKYEGKNDIHGYSIKIFFITIITCQTEGKSNMYVLVALSFNLGVVKDKDSLQRLCLF